MGIPNLLNSKIMRRIAAGNVKGEQVSEITLWRDLKAGVCPPPHLKKHGKNYWTEKQAEEYFNNRFGEVQS